MKHFDTGSNVSVYVEVPNINSAKLLLPLTDAYVDARTHMNKVIGN